MTLSTETPTRDGYTFTGWNTKTDGTGTSYAPGDSYTANEDVTLYAQWVANTPVIAIFSGAVIDNQTHQITGLIADCTAAVFEQNYVTVSGGSFEYEYPTSKQVMGTGTKVKVYDVDNQLIDTYTIVIFGDVDGDGWYNGMDAFIVSLVTAGLLSEDDLVEAAKLAADCDHDGTIDNDDFDLLERAGLLLAEVDQTSAQNGSIQTNSAYVEYLSLINQSVETEALEDDLLMDRISSEIDKPTQTEEEDQNVASSWFTKLFQMFEKCISFVMSIFFIK